MTGRSTPGSAARARYALLGVWLAVAGAGPVVAAEPLVLLVQPPPWADEAARFDARPLAALIAAAVARPVAVRQPADALSHWQAVRRADGYQLAFDEAQFSAYRIRHHRFTALARASGEVRFAIVVRSGTLVTAPADLAARRVATPAPPALAALRVMELFPQAARAPTLVVRPSRDAALADLARGRVDAVVVDASRGESVPGTTVALLTNASPGRGFTVSAALPAATRTALRRALAGARSSAAGRQALAALGVEALEVASDEVFEDSDALLRGTWGYR